MKTNKKCFMKCLSKIWTILLVHWVLIEKVDAEPLQIISQTVSAMDENQAEPVTFFFGFANQFRFELTKPAEMEIRFTALPGKNWSKNVNNSRNRRCNEVVLNAFWRAKGLNGMALT